WGCNIHDPIHALENSRTAVPLILRLAILQVNAGVCLLKLKAFFVSYSEFGEELLGDGFLIWKALSEHSNCEEARLLENARKQLQEKFLKVQSQLLEENQKREQQEAMVKNLQKHVKLLTSVSLLSGEIFVGKLVKLRFLTW
ncbi:hypothetical protein E2320_012240, partial [Naja naja]